MKTFAKFCEVIEEKAIVVLGKEAGLLVVAALDDIYAPVARSLKVGFAWHLKRYITDSLPL